MVINRYCIIALTKFVLGPNYLGLCLQYESCVYEHGTQTFYIRRELVEKLAAVDKFVYCRFAIDIYISSLGPWFSSTNNIVEHTCKDQHTIIH